MVVEVGGWVSELVLAGPETWKWTGPLFWVTTTAPWVLHSREQETLAHEWDRDRDLERGLGRNEESEHEPDPSSIMSGARTCLGAPMPPASMLRVLAARAWAPSCLACLYWAQ